jgi:hypothetical protein
MLKMKHRVDIIFNRADGSNREEAQAVIDQAIVLLKTLIDSGALRIRQAVHQDSIKLEQLTISS